MGATTSVFEYKDYKRYLSARLPTSGVERGVRARLSENLRCQAAYISQVLNGTTHFSLEHAALIDTFIGHTREESDFFMLLVSFGRAGSKILENLYLRQMEEIIQKRQVIASRLKTREALGREEQNFYYSTWYYSAIHVLLLVPQFQTREALKERLHLTVSQISEALSFLVKCGLVVEENGRFKSGAARIHLPSKSPLIARHHSNWRVRAIQSLDAAGADDMHYSGAISVSHKNAKAIRTILYEAVDRMEPVINASGEEEGYSICIDFFKF